ncbi:MAG: MTH938/NDUFAF3 family protein [Archaeoglobaceae archaeon]
MIQKYEFGKIWINGELYTTDLIILQDRVKENWWRKEGHRLSIEDLKEVIDFEPEILVVGTGYNGRMEIPNETKKFLEKRGIRLISAPTPKAVEIFNGISGKKAGAFHLTC